MDLDEFDLIEWFKCPTCGSKGAQGRRHDPLFDKEITQFYCDEDQAHHFLIIQLPPYETETLAEFMSRRGHRRRTT